VVSTAFQPLYPRGRPGTHCTGGWVGPRAGLDDPEIEFPPGFDPLTTQSVASRRKWKFTLNKSKPFRSSIKKITNSRPGVYKSWTIKFCTMVPNTCGSSVWNSIRHFSASQKFKVVPRNLEYWWIPAVGNSSVSFHILISTETHA
jgi:hypothetical protein